MRIIILAAALCLTACVADRNPVENKPPRDRAVDCGDGRLYPADYVCP